ncbi:MAG TPA: outer membrane beta-barrel protein [Xanthobacteraceae bacterium]|jgi:outer membrane immunogenic protein
MKKILIGVVASIGMVWQTAALAAELEPVITPNRVTAPPAYGKATERVVTPDIVTSPPAFSTFTRKYYNWTGAYAGADVGLNFGHFDWSYVPGGLSGNPGAFGGLLSATVGYNLQTGDPIVLGVEADLGWSGLSKKIPLADCASVCEFKNPWIATTRLRGGYAFDWIFPYLTAGAAFGEVVGNNVGAPFGRALADNLGWTVGAGVEFVIVGPWRAKVEYLHVNLGGITCVTNCTGALMNPVHVNFTTDIIRAGFDYRIWD